MDTIKLKDILDTYQRIDLYRAKYRHSDFTPYAWCFHGNKTQAWDGICKASRLVFPRSTRYNGTIEIDPVTYKYVTMKFNIGARPNVKYTPPTTYTQTTKGMVDVSWYLNTQGINSSMITKAQDGSISINGVQFAAAGIINTATQVYNEATVLNEAWKNYMEYIRKNILYEIKLSYRVGAASSDVWYNVSKMVTAEGAWCSLLYDMSAEPTWSDVITGIKVEVIPSETIPSTFTIDTQCEYIKVDKKNVFEGISQSMITTTDINTIRDDVETFAKQTLTWANPGDVTPNRVRENIDTAEISDISLVNTRITGLPPYNGCANCDDYTCACYSTDYGHVPCTTCDGCNTYTTCSSCNDKCFTQARSCTCNGICYSQPTGCTCNNRCYDYSSCSCDSTCYIEGTSCGRYGY